MARLQDGVADADPALAFQAPVAADQRDAAILEPRHLKSVVEVIDDLIPAGQDRRHVELAAARRAGTRHAARLGERLRRAQQRLGGHAGVERALTADEGGLDDRHRVTPSAEAAGEDLAGRTGAEHEDVVESGDHDDPPRSSSS